MPGVLALVLMVTHPVRDGKLLNYDDERYIAGNPWLEGRSTIDGETIWSAYFDGHYHPLTLLSLRSDRGLGDDVVRSHHTVNWLLHGLNAILVLWFVFTLTGNRTLSVGVALLWGLHPVAVESYAWMTERKNVLYTLFFLLSAIQYVLYIRERKNTRLIYTGAFFLLSCLSKGQGILLLPVYFLLDYYEHSRLWIRREWRVKAAFLVASLVFVWLGRQAQAEAWDLSNQTYDPGGRLLLGCYGFMSYLVHAVLPFDLSPYYPYPADTDAELGILHYLSPLGVLAYLWLMYKAYTRGSKLWFFGLAWFLINIILMLKILPVPYGAYLMAGRYAYVPMIGLLLPVIHFILETVRARVRTGNSHWVVIGALVILLSVASRKQIGIWNNSVSLWEEVLSEYPSYAHAANMLALGAIAEGDNSLALQAFRTMDELTPESAEAPLNQAVLYERLGEPDQADRYLQIAIDREPGSLMTIEKAALIYLRRGKTDEAYEYTSAGVERYPESQDLAILHSQVLARRGELDEAIAGLSKMKPSPEVNELLGQLRALAAQTDRSRAPSPAQPWVDQAVQAAKNGDEEEALQLFNRAIEQDPGLFEAYANRGSFYARKGELAKAEQDFLKSLEVKPNSPNVWMMLGLLYSDMGNKTDACTYYRKAAGAGLSVNATILAECETLQ